MSFTKPHTQGDWRVSKYKSGNGHESLEIHFNIDGECVAEHVHSLEDAKLISQSPKLLEFAEMFYDYWAGKETKPMLFDELEKTIEGLWC